MSKSRPSLPVLNLAVVALLAALLVACGGTKVKVVTAEKNLVYRGSLYSLARVESVFGRLEATTPGGDTVDALRLDKRGIQDLLKSHGSVTLQSAIMLDDRAIPYEQTTVDSYRAFSKVQSNLEDALGRVQKFMADAKKTQLKL